MTAFLASVPWQVWAVALVGVGAFLAIVWEETSRRLASVVDLDDPTLDLRDIDGNGGRW